MITAVVLAAGRSRRMGTQKLLLPLNGQPVIERVVDIIGRTSVTQTVVVIGQDGERIRQSLRGHRVLYAVNPDPASDMLGSVRCGLRSLPSTCQGVLVVLGDHPAIQSGWVEQLIRRFAVSQDPIVVPVFQGRRGHPLLFSTRYVPEILSEHDSVGLRGLLRKHRKRVIGVEVNSPGVLQDLDTPEDYQRQRSSLESDVQGPQK